jgi:glycosyltransferase involved in cell wall biosynthesis
MILKNPEVAPPTDLAIGNAALRAGNNEKALRHYTKAILNSPTLAKALTANFHLARKRYRAERANMRKSVAVCGWELSHNAAGRVHTLAALYQDSADVEIVGSIFPSWGRMIWEPIRNISIPLRYILVEDESNFIDQAIEFVLERPYDVIHLSKPRAPNIVWGILYELIWGANICLDVDDEELAFVGAEIPINISQQSAISRQALALVEITGRYWTQLSAGLVRSYENLSVANSALQKRYGGEIVRHARDERIYQPSAALSRTARKRFNISEDKKVVLFFGTPRAHKGLLPTAKAISSLMRDDVVFTIIGDFANQAEKGELAAVSGVDFRFVGNQSVDEGPSLLAAGDICVLLQDPSSDVSQFQIPAKLSDALAMGMAVVADLPRAILDTSTQQAIISATEAELPQVLAKLLDDESLLQAQKVASIKCFRSTYAFPLNQKPLLGFLAKNSSGLCRSNPAIVTELLLANNLKGLVPLIQTPIASVVNITKGDTGDSQDDSYKAAIVVHCFYPELWDSIKKRLVRLNRPFDLFITCPNDRLDNVVEAVSIDFPKAVYHGSDNLGMDILPFLKLIPDLVSNGYTAVCKLHTKKGDGDLAIIWRDLMLDSLIGSDAVVRKTIESLSSDASIGMVGTSCLFQSARRLMYENEKNVTRLASEIYGQELPDVDWGFFAGTMFWIDPQVLVRLGEYATANTSLLDVEYKRDGKIEHAYERFLGLAPILENKKIGLLLPTKMCSGGSSLHIRNEDGWIGTAHIGDIMRQRRRLEADVRLLKLSGMFDRSYYIEQTGITDVDFCAETHYLTEGTFKNLRPISFFNPGEYRYIHEDVRKAEIEPFIHYLSRGARENRRLLGNVARQQQEMPHARYLVLNTDLIKWDEQRRKNRRHDIISIVIPMFNKSELTEQCLESLLSTDAGKAFEIIIVENGSEKHEKERIRSYVNNLNDKRIRILDNSENFNFALGCNLGFAAANGETVVFLNNDTTVTDGWLSELVSPLQYSTFAATQPKLLYPDGTIQCVGVVFSKRSSLGYPIYAGEKGNDVRANVSRQYQAITAACMAVRAEHFITLKGFDPTYINGQEDVDFCLRLREICNKGVFYTAESVVYHHESKSPGRSVFIAHNRHIFVQRWAGMVQADDTYYYLLDSTRPYEWNVDSLENSATGIAISRPRYSGSRAQRSSRSWESRTEATCLRRLNAAYSHIRDEVDLCMVSICMPVYNRSEIVSTAIESVLAQTHRAFELIICDDGSDDDTVAVVQRHVAQDSRVRLLTNQHAGVSAARNSCMDAARGEYIFYLDSDNSWQSDYLTKMITFLIEGKLDSAYCAIKVFGDDPSDNRYLGARFDWLECIAENYVDLNCFSHKRGIANNIRFDTQLKRLVDWDLILGITSYSSCSYLPYVGVSYYDGEGYSRITNLEAKGALVGELQHRVRLKYGGVDLVRATDSELRPNWSSLLNTSLPAMTYDQLMRDSMLMRLRARGNRFQHRIDKIRHKSNRLNIRIKVPAPSLDVAQEWGDFHFAIGLKKALELEGHCCEIDCLNSWYTDDSASADVILVLRGLSRYVVNAEQVNLLWLISHPAKVVDSELNEYDHVFVASKQYSEILSKRLFVPVTTLYQAVDAERFNPSMAKSRDGDREEILFVGNSRNIFRTIVKDAIIANLKLSVYGTRWTEFIPPEVHKGEHISNSELGKWYGAAGVVLNDHWDDMRSLGFISNRLFDITACGGRVISDNVEGLEEVFGDFITTYSGSRDLKEKVRILVAEDEIRFMERLRFAETIIRDHSFTARAKQLLVLLPELSTKLTRLRQS